MKAPLKGTNLFAENGSFAPSAVHPANNSSCFPNQFLFLQQNPVRMKRLKEIILNDSELDMLLSEEEKSGYNLLLNNIFCFGCGDLCNKGIVTSAVKLDSRNDIVVEGNCNVCGHRVARVMEFGENESFFDKAMHFRKSLQNGMDM
jgi:hypothetical protein